MKWSLLCLVPLAVLALPASGAAPGPEQAKAFFECRTSWDGRTAPLPEIDRRTADGLVHVRYRLPKALTVFGLKPTESYVTLGRDGRRVRTSTVPGRLEEVAPRIIEALQIPAQDVEHIDVLLFQHWKLRQAGGPLVQVQAQLTNTGEPPASVIFCIEGP